jgi:KDO2-lipid IV(A) lauroyltransferase
VNPQVLLPYGSRLAAALPRAWAERAADIAGDLVARCLPRLRQVVGENLEQAIGAPIPDPVRRRTLATYARYYLSLMRLAHRSPTDAVGPMRSLGVEALGRTLARGRGAVALGAHLGNWDMAAVALAGRFGLVHAFVEPLQPAAVLRFYTQLRKRHGVSVVCLGEHGRVPFEVLRANGILGLLVDRPFGKRVLRVPFGGGDLLLPSGGIRLGLRAGAGIHAVFCVLTADGVVLHVGEDLSRGLPDGDERARVRHVATRFGATLQSMVHRHPDQWCVLTPLQRRDEELQRGAA